VHDIGSLKYLKPLSLAVLAVSTFSNASTITFDLVGVTSSAGTLTGTVDIDSATKLVTAAQITLNDILAGNPVFNTPGSQATHNGVGQSFIVGATNSPLNSGGELKLYYDITSFGTGSGILDICLQGVACGDRGTVASDLLLYGGDGTQGPVYLTAGEFEPTAPESSSSPVPEPSSLVLIGTGIFFGALLLARFGGGGSEVEHS
jgi:hypothetical protein